MTQAVPPAGIRKVALTGGIASGKSLVGDYLQSVNVPVIDADALVHDILEKDADVQGKIRQTFGDDVFVPSTNRVDRHKLGAKVFADNARRKLLESWIHPKVREAIERFFTQHKDKPLGVAMIPLLFESNLEKHYDEVWLIDTDEETQVQRLMARPRDPRPLTREEAMARIQSQMPMEEKRARAKQMPAHHIIDNRGTVQALYEQVRQILKKHGITV